MERRQPENATDVAFCNYFYGGLIKPLKTELQAYRDESALGPSRNDACKIVRILEPPSLCLIRIWL